MENCDVLIVGGGPAGAACARRLRQSGMDAMVLDKENFPRDKVCAGWVTPAVVDALGMDLADYRAEGLTLEPIRGFVTGMIGGAEVYTDYGETVSYGIRRREFDHYLLRRSGARLALGEPLRSLERVGRHWIVNGRLRTPMLIGAGGHFCPVARRLGARVGDLRGAVAAQEVEFALSPAQRAWCEVRPGVPELYFCEDLKGYGWCLVKGDVLNIGLGREDRHRLSEHLSRFVESLKRSGRIPADLPERFHGHAYLLYGAHEPRRIVDDGVLLIGDAAGLAYPQSGEGIRPAVESALLAAETVLDAGGEYRSADLRPYEEALVERFGEREGIPGLSARIPEGLQRRLAARLLSNGWFARHFVLDRWFLHRNQAAVGVPALSVAGG